MRLRYSDPDGPGFTRRKRGTHWTYYDPEGARVSDEAITARLNALGVPPAYERVWFSPHDNGHLQAIGYDAKGRRQYRYHSAFREKREGAKYSKCVDFGEALPDIRARVEADLALRGLPRDKVVAAIVRLLDRGHVRVGNEGYARDNDSYGATTLLTEHSDVKGATVRLSYRGKSGKDQNVRLNDAALAKIVRRCQDLEGQALFQYLGDDGEPRRIGSGDVNAYIQDAMGDEFSAKHFRTWGASVIALKAIRDFPDGDISLKLMLQPVADALGNTPAISRKSYVHPLLIAAVREGRAGEVAALKLPRATKWLSGEERLLIAMLKA